MIADVAELGYLDRSWLTLDPTYGRGRFWSKWRPDTLITSDLLVPGAMHAWDFTALPSPDRLYQAVVFDPPYKLNGTPAAGDSDAAYGVDRVASWQERHALIRAGIDECCRVLKPGGVLLVKCQDQVCGGRMRWQTREFADHAETHGVRLIDRFDLLGKSRPQPMEGRRQQHAHGRPSTLLVFR
jgi:hypothetical protein